jgi:glycosyltransferase involved in cell wall biosynthesis
MTDPQRRLSLLHIAYLFPYPPRSGTDHRLWQICRHEARNADVTVLCRALRPLSEEIRRAERESNIHFNCLVLPRPRAVQKVTKGLRFLFSRYPVISAGWYFPEMRRAIRRSIEARPDIVVFEGTYNVLYWPQLKSFQGLKVLNLYDLETDRLRRQAAVMKPRLNRLLHNAERRMSRIERVVCGTADLVWVTSMAELNKVSRLYPNTRAEIAPNGVDCSFMQVLPAPSGKEILFVGSLNNLPNIDAVSFFANKVMPLVLERHPDAVFKVVGCNPGAQILALHAPPHVVIAGEADSLEPYYSRAAVCVAPIRSGGGTRLKILEAMAFGRPVVSTTFGADGLDVENGRHLLLADSPHTMARIIGRVLAGEEDISGLIGRARELVETRYDWREIAQRMCNRYDELLTK